MAFHQRTSSGERQTVAQYKNVSVNVPINDKDFAVPGQHLNDFSFIGGGNTATIPFKLVNNHIHIRVKVNGHPLHFVLDSGSRNILSRQAAKAVGVKAKGTLQGVRVGFGTKTVSAGFAKVKNLVLGDKVALRNQNFFVIPLPDLSTTTSLDGMVGYGVFKRFVVRIDYANHLLTLIRPENFFPEGAGVPVPLKFHNDKVAVKAFIDGLPGYFEIDTGFHGSLLLYTPFSKANNLYTRYRATPPVVGSGFAGVVHRRVARGGELTIGSVTVKGPIMALGMATQGADAKKDLAGNIGTRILQRFTVTFDYADKRMYLKPNENYGKPMNYDRSGMKVKGTNRGFKVMGVMKGGPAAKAGIETGDVITAVNGKLTSGADSFAFMQMLRSEPLGTTIKLTIGKGETAHTATITLRRLIPKTGGAHKKTLESAS